MKTTTEFKPLVEFGSPVTMEFRERLVPALSDVNSGYVFFEPPPDGELNDYYQREYPRMHAQTGYYTIEADYDAAKNLQYADQILSVYDMVMKRPPRVAFELGCSFGGLVAEMKSRGIPARGADINAMAITQGRELRDNATLECAGNLEALARMTGPVDLIYSLDSLEHDPDMLRVIAACRDRLTEDGLLFVMVPNAMYAGSVFGGFRNNWWVNYPQHLHMPSPGFIPALSRTLGFVPVFWDTGILFEDHAQPPILGMFNEGEMTETRRDLWSMLLLGAGFGMALNFALTPDTNAMRFARLTQDINGTLEHARQQEVEIRRYLRNATALGTPS